MKNKHYIPKDKFRNLPRGTVLKQIHEDYSLGVILRFVDEDRVKIAWIPRKCYYNKDNRWTSTVSIWAELIEVMQLSNIHNVTFDTRRLDMLDILYDNLEEFYGDLQI